jgi:hypothetical protein
MKWAGWYKLLPGFPAVGRCCYVVTNKRSAAKNLLIYTVVEKRQ